MRLQFFHVRDLCKLMKTVIEERPKEHILNVGNPETVTVKEWVEKCYACMGVVPEFVQVYDDVEQRRYFSFYDYAYELDVTRQRALLRETVSLDDGLRECAAWYRDNGDEVKKKPFLEFIQTTFEK